MFLQQETRKQVKVSYWLDNSIGLFPEKKPKTQKNISYLLAFKIMRGGGGGGLYLFHNCGMISIVLFWRITNITKTQIDHAILDLFFLRQAVYFLENYWAV